MLKHQSPPWDKSIDGFFNESGDEQATLGALTTQRQGGKSLAAYKGLNLGDHVDDDPTTVLENRRLLVEAFNLPTEPIWLTQTHTNDVFHYSSPEDLDQLKSKAFDAIYTREKGIVCAVMTADCMPLLVSNADSTEVAAIHAGWRGMADNIIENTLALFRSPMSEVHVWAGPTISQEYFEIGNEVKEQLGGDIKHYADHQTDKNKCFADLYGIARQRVESLGANYTASEACTYRDEGDYYSYRRDGVTGRMVSLIWR